MKQVKMATEEGLLLEAERMKQVVRDSDAEIEEMNQIEAYRKDEEQDVKISCNPR